MRKNVFLILLLIVSCGQQPTKQPKSLLSDLNVDFPVTDTVLLKSKYKLAVVSDINSFMVKDSIIFVYESNKENFGHCYNINTGEEISTMLTRGNAANEMNAILFMHNKFYKDSLQFYDDDLHEVKTFAVNDIVTKKLGDRGFSAIKLPESIYTSSFIKTDNTIIGFVRSAGRDNDSLKNKFFSYDGKETVYFGELKDELIEADAETSNHSKRTNLEFRYATNGNRVVVASFAGIMLEVINTDKKTVDFERYYNKINLPDVFIGPNNLMMYSISCDDKYIYCHVIGLIRKDSRDKESITNNYIYVFDWELNPVKKYYLGSFKTDAGFYSLSEDGKTLYFMAIDEEKQELYEATI